MTARFKPLSDKVYYARQRRNERVRAARSLRELQLDHADTLAELHPALCTLTRDAGEARLRRSVYAAATRAAEADEPFALRLLSAMLGKRWWWDYRSYGNAVGTRKQMKVIDRFARKLSDANAQKKREAVRNNAALNGLCLRVNMPPKCRRGA